MIFLSNLQRIPDYLKTGRLVLLSKTDSPTVKLDDTRPLTILSLVYKIIELYLYPYVMTYIWPTISGAQNGFRKGYSKQDNIIAIRDWMAFRKRYKIPSFVLSIDINKAFDIVYRLLLLKK